MIAEHGAHILAVGLCLAWMMWRWRAQIRFYPLAILVLALFFSLEVGVFTSHHASAHHAQRPCCIPSLPVFSLAFTAAPPQSVFAESVVLYKPEYLSPVVTWPSNKSPPLA